MVLTADSVECLDSLLILSEELKIYFRSKEETFRFLVNLYGVPLCKEIVGELYSKYIKETGMVYANDKIKTAYNKMLFALYAYAVRHNDVGMIPENLQLLIGIREEKVAESANKRIAGIIERSKKVIDDINTAKTVSEKDRNSIINIQKQNNKKLFESYRMDEINFDPLFLVFKNNPNKVHDCLDKCTLSLYEWEASTKKLQTTKDEIIIEENKMKVSRSVRNIGMRIRELATTAIRNHNMTTNDIINLLKDEYQVILLRIKNYNHFLRMLGMKRLELDKNIFTPFLEITGVKNVDALCKVFDSRILLEDKMESEENRTKAKNELLSLLVN